MTAKRSDSMDDHADLTHSYPSADAFDGGDLDCGSGLLLLIRKHIDPLTAGSLLEIRSTESSVAEDLPSWCRMTNNELVSTRQSGRRFSFLVSKGRFDPDRAQPTMSKTPAIPLSPSLSLSLSAAPQAAHSATAPVIAPLSVLGIGSWPRPDWMLSALTDYLEGRLPDEAFQAIADQACALAIQAQEAAGADAISDGEQRRDSYASFVGSRLANCQLIPLTDLLPYVEHPEEFERELASLDVPASKVRHPAVFGKIARDPLRPLAAHELRFALAKTAKPVKIALPGPYVLTRTMWLECVSDRAYDVREELANDVVIALRAEIQELLDLGAAIVQMDEPVLTEVVHGRAGLGNRSFMCGALGEKRAMAEELDFAEGLINRVADGFPADRLAVHICRGNWTADESAALAGDYRPLVPLLSRLRVGTLFLELCVARAGEGEELAQLPRRQRIGVGVVNQKSPRIETPEEIVANAERMIERLGPERVLLNPDCGFATFADHPICPQDVAKAKLAAMVQASRLLRSRYHLNE